MRFTPPKINIEPENDGLEDDVPFQGVYSQVPLLIFRGCMFFSLGDWKHHPFEGSRNDGCHYQPFFLTSV